jgi:hypothetical protein
MSSLNNRDYLVRGSKGAKPLYEILLPLPFARGEGQRVRG